MIYWDLLIGFLQVGCFAFGGAYGAIPLIRDVVLSYGWMNDETLSYMIAISESTPGPIMVNMATYIGSSQGGLLGAAIATTAVVLPAFCIILLVMILLKSILDHPYCQAVLRGLKPCIIGIILATGISMILSNCLPLSTPDYKAIGLTAVLAATLFGSKWGMKKKLSPIALICIAAVLGIAVYGI
nr:chromate transporter [Oscillospiraceae bacterium]